MREFIHANLPYLLLATLALGLLCTEREIGFALSKGYSVREDGGIMLGLGKQRLLALAVLLFAVWKIMRRRPRRPRSGPYTPRK